MQGLSAQRQAPSLRLQGGRRRRQLRLRRSVAGWLFAAPWLIGFLGFTAGPMLASVYLSFTSYDLMQAPRWIGLANFNRLLDDPRVWNSIKVTTLFSFISVPVNLLFGLVLALLLNQRIRGLGVWRTLYYLPAIVPAAAMGMLWRWLLDGQFGFVNYLLEDGLGIAGPNWLTSRDWVIPAFIIMSFWGVGVPMVINLAGLQNIPVTLYEAAQIDGASGWRKLRDITLPLLSPVILFNLLIGIIGALQSFTIFFVVTGGGPNHASETLMLYLYDNAFQFLRMGYASALAWVLFVYILIVTLIVHRFSSQWVYYESPLERKDA
ncbi:MAG: oligogalacturonide transport system permease protein [Thermomicrobiales bacterium]|nr:oligogalacturonide transport system permease protein [Thermomicrobiales bacterium]